VLPDGAMLEPETTEPERLQGSERDPDGREQVTTRAAHDGRSVRSPSPRHASRFARNPTAAIRICRWRGTAHSIASERQGLAGPRPVGMPPDLNATGADQELVQVVAIDHRVGVAMHADDLHNRAVQPAATKIPPPASVVLHGTTRCVGLCGSLNRKVER
jgi:hypothetical protein